jgi:hypothetical protein
MRWYEKQETDEELNLIAWHRMINDSLLTVYTFEDGQESRQYVNPNIPIKPKWYNQLDKHGVR